MVRAAPCKAQISLPQLSPCPCGPAPPSPQNGSSGCIPGLCSVSSVEALGSTVPVGPGSLRPGSTGAAAPRGRKLQQTVWLWGKFSSTMSGCSGSGTHEGEEEAGGVASGLCCQGSHSRVLGLSPPARAARGAEPRLCWLPEQGQPCWLQSWCGSQVSRSIWR